MTFSSSLASPFSPWIVRAHLRRWTSRSRVCRARPTAACSTWRLRAGRDMRYTSLRRWPVWSRASSMAATVSLSARACWSWASIVLNRSLSSATSEFNDYFNSFWMTETSSLMSFRSSSWVRSPTVGWRLGGMMEYAMFTRGDYPLRRAYFIADHNVFHTSWYQWPWRGVQWCVKCVPAPSPDTKLNIIYIVTVPWWRSLNADSSDATHQ